MPQIAIFDSYLILFARGKSHRKKPKAGKMSYNLKINDVSEILSNLSRQCL